MVFGANQKNQQTAQVGLELQQALAAIRVNAMNLQHTNVSSKITKKELDTIIKLSAKAQKNSLSSEELVNLINLQNKLDVAADESNKKNAKYQHKLSDLISSFGSIINDSNLNDTIRNQYTNQLKQILKAAGQNVDNIKSYQDLNPGKLDAVYNQAGNRTINNRKLQKVSPQALSQNKIKSQSFFGKTGTTIKDVSKSLISSNAKGVLGSTLGSLGLGALDTHFNLTDNIHYKTSNVIGNVLNRTKRNSFSNLSGLVNNTNNQSIFSAFNNPNAYKQNIPNNTGQGKGPRNNSNPNNNNTDPVIGSQLLQAVNSGNVQIVNSLNSANTTLNKIVGLLTPKTITRQDLTKYNRHIEDDMAKTSANDNALDNLTNSHLGGGESSDSHVKEVVGGYVGSKTLNWLAKKFPKVGKVLSPLIKGAGLLGTSLLGGDTFSLLEGSSLTGGAASAATGTAAATTAITGAGAATGATAAGGGLLSGLVAPLAVAGAGALGASYLANKAEGTRNTDYAGSLNNSGQSWTNFLSFRTLDKEHDGLNGATLNGSTPNNPDNFTPNEPLSLVDKRSTDTNLAPELKKKTKEIQETQSAFIGYLEAIRRFLTGTSQQLPQVQGLASTSAITSGVGGTLNNGTSGQSPNISNGSPSTLQQTNTGSSPRSSNNSDSNTSTGSANPYNYTDIHHLGLGDTTNVDSNIGTTGLSAFSNLGNQLGFDNITTDNTVKNSSSIGSGLNGGFDTNPDKAVTASQYRPAYKLGDSDLDDRVVRTIAGEAAVHNKEGVDAVINTMFNRIGTKQYGPSSNLLDVAGAPNQFAGFNKGHPTAEQSQMIRDRIRAIASGTVADNTNGANEFRTNTYQGKWAQNHPEKVDIGGNNFARNNSVQGTYSPYDKPKQNNNSKYDSFSPATPGQIASIGSNSVDNLAKQIKKISPNLSNEDCVTLAKQTAGISGSVSNWRRGDNAIESGTLKPGTPLATFLDRKGNQSDKYDGGEGTGKSGTNTTHAGVFNDYIRDKNGKITGFSMYEQYNGSGGPHLKNYSIGDKRGGEKDASNYFSVNDTKGNPAGTNNPMSASNKTIEAQQIQDLQKALPVPSKDQLSGLNNVVQMKNTDNNQVMPSNAKSIDPDILKGLAPENPLNPDDNKKIVSPDETLKPNNNSLLSDKSSKNNSYNFGSFKDSVDVNGKTIGGYINTPNSGMAGSVVTNQIDNAKFTSTGNNLYTYPGNFNSATADPTASMPTPVPVQAPKMPDPTPVTPAPATTPPVVMASSTPSSSSTFTTPSSKDMSSTHDRKKPDHHVADPYLSIMNNQLIKGHTS